LLFNHFNTCFIPHRRFQEIKMIVTTTHDIQDRKITAYLGIVNGEVIVGANIFKDLFAGVRDIVGGRAGAYERTLDRARREAIEEIKAEGVTVGADAIVGITFDYESIGSTSTMLMVTVTGTAVKLA
jgi:uncharacterized protein YbjQ (UPF0145 family)